jgi:hypothetical protein
MYKSRFTKWGDCGKHNRPAEMAFAFRKKKQRDAQGKKSTFIIGT